MQRAYTGLATTRARRTSILLPEPESKRLRSLRRDKATYSHLLHDDHFPQSQLLLRTFSWQTETSGSSSVASGKFPAIPGRDLTVPRPQTGRVLGAVTGCWGRLRRRGRKRSLDADIALLPPQSAVSASTAPCVSSATRGNCTIRAYLNKSIKCCIWLLLS